MVEQITKGSLFVSPAEFFCGDNVRLSYDFKVSDITAMEISDLNGKTITRPAEMAKIIKPDPDAFEVKNISFTTNGNSVHAQIDIIFWETGSVKLPAIELATEDQTVEIYLPKIEVSSIIEKTKVTTLQEYIAPQLIPGTTYLVYGGIFIFIVVIFLMIFAAVKMPKIKQFLLEKKTKRKYRKNYKKSVLAVKNLLKNADSCTNENFCCELQKILRDFFVVRFSPEIYNLATNEIMGWFNRMFQKILPENAENAIQLFYETMYRCDFIRFSGADQENGGMQPGEKVSLADSAVQIFDLIEKGNK